MTNEKKYGVVEIDSVETYESCLVINWVCRIGFGQLTVYSDSIDSECMSPEFCKYVFAAYVDKCVSSGNYS